MENSPRSSSFLRFLSMASGWYVALLLFWFLLYLIFGDGLGYLGLFNALAVYFFFPLPLALLSAVASRRWRLLPASLLAVGIFAWLWGPLFLPSASAVPTGQGLRVMTINVLGKAGQPEAILDSIQTASPDVVFIQEFTPDLASSLSLELKETMPYQVLNADYGSNGLAVFSRFPLERLDVVLQGSWRGDPQVLHMDWEGRAVTLVNFHTLSTGGVWPRLVRYTTRERLETLTSLADFAAGEGGLLIAAGDANTTRLNDAYKELDAVLDDAWWEAGWGLGHTFPGQINSDDWFTRVSFFIIPHWLVRIDFVFYSAQFQASTATLAEFNGGSDHRGVVTDLVWLGD